MLRFPFVVLGDAIGFEARQTLVLAAPALTDMTASVNFVTARLHFSNAIG